MYQDFEEVKKPSRAFTTLLIVVLAVLLVVGTMVEIGYYHDITRTMDGVEHERDALRSENEMLRSMMLQKLGDNERNLQKIIDTLAQKKN